MKVLIISEWNVLHGGAEAYALQLKDALMEAGEEVRLLAADVSPEARQFADYLAPASDQILVKSVQQLMNPFAAATVRNVVRSFKPDIALVNMFALYLSPSAIFALGEVPYFLLVSDYKWTCPLGHRLLPDQSICHYRAGMACLRNHCLSLPHWMRDQVRYHRIGDVIRGAASIVSSSDAMRESLAEQGIESRRIHLFSDPPELQLPRQATPQPLFLYVGRLDIEKGVDTLLHAFAACLERAPESGLRLIGQGSARPSLERLATTLGIQESVSFRGWQEPRQINHELSRAWALVVPSRWPEPFGLVALEAIFRGVPAVVTDHGGLAETVEHGVTGLLFPPNDTETLARQLVELATGRSFPEHALDPEQVARMQDLYSRDRHVARLREIMHEIAANPGPPTMKSTLPGGTPDQGA